MEAESPSNEKQVQFASTQNSVGINIQNFFNKFVFHQNSDLQAFYIDTSEILPSQCQHMNIEEINICTFMMSQLIFKVGQSLKLPVSTSIVAVSISQYFYTRKSFIDQDFREVAMGAMFLACKSEQTLRRSYQIASCFSYIFKLFEGTFCNGRNMFSNQEQYNFIKSKVLKMESEILFDLGFQIYKLFDIPTRYISGFLAFFNKHPKSLQIVQTSWALLNDIYKTRACLYFPGQFLAAAAVYLSLIKLKVSSPTCPWWILMQSNLKSIQYICFLVQQMRDIIACDKVKFTKISIMLQKIGFNKSGIKNVFPVPYFRKIKMELTGTYKLSSNLSFSTIITKNYVNQENILNSHQSNLSCKLKENGNEGVDEKQIKKQKDLLLKYKNKKQKRHKNKHKKDKQKRNRSRSKDEKKIYKSSSSSQSKSISKQQTPKVNNKQKYHHQRKNMILDSQILGQNVQSLQQKNYQIKEVENQNQKISEQQKSRFKTKQLQVKNSKDLLSKISMQLKRHQIKKETIKDEQKQLKQVKFYDEIPMKDQLKNENQIKEEVNDSEQDEELLAQLIRIKKQNKQVNNIFKAQQNKKQNSVDQKI